MGVTCRERGLELLADGRPHFRGLRALRRPDHRAAPGSLCQIQLQYQSCDHAGRTARGRPRAGGILAAAVRTASPDGLAWHPHGYFTAAGFAAIGAAEGLVHGHDIAAGLGLAWSPSPQLCGQVLSTVFPDAGQRAGSTALTNLLIQTGRDERPKDQPPRIWTYSAAARSLSSDP